MLNFSGNPTPDDLNLAATLLIKQRLPQAIELVPTPNQANNWCFNAAENRFAGHLITADGDRLAWQLQRTGSQWEAIAHPLEFAEDDELLPDTEWDSIANAVGDEDAIDAAMDALDRAAESLENVEFSESCRVGSTVRWKYGSGTGTGKVVKIYRESISLRIKNSEITRNGTEDDPALLIKQDGGDRVLKLQSEVSIASDYAEEAKVANPLNGLDEQGQQDLIDLLDEVYQDGVERIVGAKLDSNGDIRVVFEDINGRVVRRFAGKIEDPDGEPVVTFKLASEGAGNFSEAINFAAKTKANSSGKTKNCTPGKSIACGASCVSIKKTCRSSQPLSPAGKAKTKAVKQKLQTAAGSATATPTPTPTPTAKPAKTPKSKASKTPKASTPTAPPSPIKTNQAELDQSRADLVNRFGAKTVEDAENNVKRILDESDVFIRVGSSSTLEQILGDRFKTAHELGRSQHDIPFLQDDYLTARARVEAKTLGYDEKATAASDRPIYAYMGGKDMDGDSHAQVAAAYGSIAVKLRSEVKDRTTFTGADSFKSGIASEVRTDGAPPPPNAASMVGTTRHGFDRANLPDSYPSYYSDDTQDGGMLRAAGRAKSIDDLVPQLAPTGNAYMEAQVHGQVKPTDIAEIRFTPKGAGDRPTPAIAQFAKDNGVDLYVNDRKLSSSELDTAINPPTDKRSQRVRDLADALEKGDIDSVVQLADDLGSSSAKIDLNPGETDRTLKQLRTEAGYDGLPRVGTAQDVTDAWKNGGVLMARGEADSSNISGRDILKQFQAGSFHTGNGVYGNGTYVGHAGKFVNGRYVGYDPKTEAEDAKRAVENVAKYGYINDSTTNVRMALDNTAVVVSQSDLLNDRERISTQINTWANRERSRLAGDAKVFTDSDEQNYRQRVRDVDDKYDSGNPEITSGRTQKLNGGLTSRTDQTWEFEGSSVGDPPLRMSVSVSKSQGDNGRTFTLRDDQGNPIATVQQASGAKPNFSTINDLRDAAIERETLDALNLKIPPIAGQVNDPDIQRQIQDLDDRVARTRQILGVEENDEGGSIERLAILRGVDAITLDQSYEPETFMNLLNRSKVVVQQDPLSWDRANTVGAL